MVQFILFAEDHGHRFVVERLTDRVLCDPQLNRGATWLEIEIVKDLRSWRGIEPHEPFTKLSALKTIAKTHGVPPLHGRFAGEPGAPDAALFRKALRIAQHCCECDAVVIARDLDGARSARAFEQAATDRAWPFVSSWLVPIRRSKRG